MNPCMCGHPIEDHDDIGGRCSGTTEYRGKEEPCKCVEYEEDTEAADHE